MPMGAHLLTAEQTATRLGVKLSTVYAYVSRGVLDRQLAEDGRTSRFDVAQVDQIAQRGRPRADGRRLGGVDVSLATAITSIEGERLFYRGHDAVVLAGQVSFEQAAELLWSGELPAPLRWPVAPARVGLRGLNLPGGSAPLERMAVVTALLACSQPLRIDLRPDSVCQHARALISHFVEATELVPKRRGRAATQANARARTAELRGGIAARLWPRLTQLTAAPARVAVLDAALVLLADHELATSTFAARVAASTRADPFAIVLAGLGTVSGPLHGKAALGAHELLLDAEQSRSPERAVARTLGARGMVPGFGHGVYLQGDPRAQRLLGMLGALIGRSERGLVDAVATTASGASGKQPNVDFALAAFAFAARMPLGATEAIFAIARSAGWIAHALEEYGEKPLRFRARAIYIGKPGRSAALPLRFSVTARDSS
jgi:citrate synthase